ncbi:MAG: hypothetical protein P1V81_12770 [Planctomycetota bacterium]|nr:hypothetical protein [Planctomycetota bacterium]
MVTASRNYVCVRPQTYEDKAEAELLLSLFSGRSGVLENTVFCVLAPDGKEKLSRAGRSPAQQFRDADAFTSFLDKTFEPFAKEAKPLGSLPIHDELALALNVGACDSLPVAVLVAKDDRAMAKLEERVAKVAWTADHIARQHFVRVVGKEAIAAAKEDQGLELEDGLNLFEPDAFGRNAKLLGQLAPGLSTKHLGEQLAEARGDHSPAEKSRREHIRNARREGITWDSELPVTDPGEGKGRDKK